MEGLTLRRMPALWHPQALGHQDRGLTGGRGLLFRQAEEVVERAPQEARHPHRRVEMEEME